MTDRSTAWLVLGFAGQAIFTARFLVQWLESERCRSSVVPVAFWWLSLLGGSFLLIYACSRHDPVIVLGQSLGVFVYVRNLMLVKKNRRRTEKASAAGRGGQDGPGRDRRGACRPAPCASGRREWGGPVASGGPRRSRRLSGPSGDSDTRGHGPATTCPTASALRSSRCCRRVPGSHARSTCRARARRGPAGQTPRILRLSRSMGVAAMSSEALILVAGAAGRVGGVGGAVVERLRGRGLPVRALVRRDDERAEALRATGAEVVVGDLTRAEDVARALEGCRRIYFGMSVSAPYLEATVTAAAVARDRGDLEVLVNISQLTVSQMSLTAMTDSPQQRQHWLGRAGAELVGIARRAHPGHGLPPEPLLLDLGRRVDRQGRHDPPAVRRRDGPRRSTSRDVAEVVATILASPAAHVGKVYELTGPRSQDMQARAAEYLRGPRPAHHLCRRAVR